MTGAADNNSSEGRLERPPERQGESTLAGNLAFSPTDVRTAVSSIFDNQIVSPSQLQVPRADMAVGDMTFKASDPNSLQSILGLRPPQEELSTLFGRVRSDQPGAAAPGQIHPKVFDAAVVGTREGPYQTAQRLLGDSFSHKEKMAFVRAMQAQYREELGTNPALAGKKADMSDLARGHGLVRQDNHEAIMQKLRQSNPELADRVADALSQEPSGRASRGRRSGDNPPEARDPYAEYGRTERDRRGQRERERRDPYEQYGGTERDRRTEADPDRRFNPGEKARELIEAAKHMASRLGTVGWCSRGVRLALERIGHTFHAPHAVAMGRRLEGSGLFERHDIPINQAQPGDIIVRDWNASVQRQKGYNAGDIIVVTGRNSNGTLRGANDHHWSQIPDDGGRYRNSYILRFRS